MSCVFTGAECGSARAVELPTLSIILVTNQPKIVFTGTIVSAETPEGPWIPVPGAVSPYTPGLREARMFYRGSAPASQGIFSSRTVIPLTLTGPFQAHFDLAYAGLPDGFIPPVREKPYFNGSISLPGLVVPASIRVRGNSSLQECPFPKLKFKVAKEDRAGTPFAEAREVNIGTHCAEGGTGMIGRLRDQTATFREALAYEILDLMGFVAPRVRRARIEYRDTTPDTNSNTQVGWKVTREALIFDNVEVVAERLGARLLTEAELPLLTYAAFDPQEAADLQVFHALIGNWDYSLGWGSRGVWNTDVLEIGGRQLVPLAADFDLASIVTGRVRPSAPSQYHPELGQLEREMLYTLEQIQARVAPANFAAAKARFLERRPALESLVASAELDDQGRANALHHLQAFYDALALRYGLHLNSVVGRPARP